MKVGNLVLYVVLDSGMSGGMYKPQPYGRMDTRSIFAVILLHLFLHCAGTRGAFRLRKSNSTFSLLATTATKSDWKYYKQTEKFCEVSLSIRFYQRIRQSFASQ